MLEVEELEAIVFTAPGETEIRRFAMLSVGPKDVVTRTLYSMVSSGTELRVFAGRGEAEGKFPLVPGYVTIGEVIHIGPEVKGYSIGDLIMGRNSGRALPGVELVYGGQQSHHVYPATGSVQPILLPPGAKPLDYVVGELAAISGRGVQMAAPRPGETAVVVGQGLIGGLSAAWLAAAGCRVIVLDMEPYRLERAARWGVSAVVNARDEDPAARVAALCPDGADIVVDASANPAGLKLACSLLRAESPLVIRTPAWPRLVVQASYKSEIPMHPNGFFPGEGVLVLTPGDRRLADRVAAVEAIRTGRLPSAAFLDEITSYRNAPEAYFRLRDHPESVFSLVFNWTS